MILAVASLLVLAALAPILCRWTAHQPAAHQPAERQPAESPGKGVWASRLLALIPLAWAIEFARHTGRIAAGEVLQWRTTWVDPARLGFGQLDLPRLDLAFRLDGLSLLFALLICGIGAVVVLYAGAYFDKAQDRGRFLSYLFVFMASMLGLVLADDVLLLFLFWEGTSISSYLLIGFGHRREAARKAARQGLLVTALGGLALLAGLLLLVQVGGVDSLSGLLSAAADETWLQRLHAHPLYLPLLLLIFLGAATKSAQFPFHFWLPGAMSAPTPASAFLHSATMVKAGVYLLARLHPALGGTSAWFYLLTTVGLVTMLMGAWLAPRQRDLKLVLAYSTVSVLGTLVFLLGLDADITEKAVVVLILAHALYKATLFLTTGALDYATGTRDTTQLARTARTFPGLAAAALLAALSMAGAPLFYGFLGKETLLQATLESARAPDWLVVLVFVVSVWTVIAASIAGIGPFFVGQPSPTPRKRSLPWELWLAPALLAACGLVLGMLKDLPGHWWIEPATSVMRGHAVPLAEDPEGFASLTFSLKMLALIAGFALYGFYLSKAGQRWRAWDPALLGRLEHGLAVTPQRTWRGGVEKLSQMASWQSRFLQAGPLSWHLRLVLGSGSVLLLVSLARRALFSHEPSDLPTSWLTGSIGQTLSQDLAPNLTVITLTVILLGAAAVGVRARQRLAAVTALGVVGFAIAALFLLYGAPDLAMTLIVTETLTVVLLVLAFSHLPNFERFSAPSRRRRDALLATFVGVTVTSLVLLALELGSSGSEPAHDQASISEFFAQQSVVAGHGRNVVNVILVDFRALDTLGELTVVALAGLGVFALLRLRPPGGSSVGARRSKSRGSD